MVQFVTTAVLASALFLTAQGASQAICGLHGRYLNTEDNHTPCDIAAILLGGGVKAADSPFPDLNSLNADRYPAPKPEEADGLRCNYIFYNLVSGCSSCQGSIFNWTTWDEWTVNCNKVFTGASYIAEHLPGEVPLPSWIFIPPSVTGGTWNKSVAYDESLANDVPDTFFTKQVIYRTAVSQEASVSQEIFAGSIAGATVGGFIFGALVAAVLLLLRKKRANVTLDLTSDRESIDTITREKGQANFQA